VCVCVYVCVCVLVCVCVCVCVWQTGLRCGTGRRACAVALADGRARKRGNEYPWRCASMAMRTRYGTSLDCDMANVVMRPFCLTFCASVAWQCDGRVLIHERTCVSLAFFQFKLAFE